MEELNKIIREIKSIAYQMSNHNDCNKSEEEDIKDGTHIKMDDLSYRLELLINEFEKSKTIDMKNMQNKREHINVAIISVVDKEFEALNDVFNNFEKAKNEIKLENRIKVWKSSFKQKKEGKKELSLLFAKIGSAGNLTSFAFTDYLLKKFDIDLIILCGIAAGNNELVNIYSSVVSNRVIYYEGQKLKEDGSRYRLEPLSISESLNNDFLHLNQIKLRWKKDLFKILKKTNNNIDNDEITNLDWINNNWKEGLGLKRGQILAGEKLFADGKTFNKLISDIEIGKDIFAGEMEGYGFAFACKKNEHSNWLIFRGISDFGGNEKSSPANEKYQIIAAYSAATFIYDYLAYEYL